MIINKFTTSYSPRRSEIYVFDMNGKQMFSIDSNEIKDVEHLDNASIEKFVATNYGEELRDMGLMVHMPVYRLFCGYEDQEAKDSVPVTTVEFVAKCVDSVTERVWLFVTELDDVDEIYIDVDYVSNPAKEEIFKSALKCMQDHMNNVGLEPEVSEDREFKLADETIRVHVDKLVYHGQDCMVELYYLCNAMEM